MAGETAAIGRLVPRGVVIRVAHMLDLAGVNMKPEAFVGLVLIISALIPVLTFFLVSFVMAPYALVLAICMIFVVIGIIYAYIILLTDARKNKVEEVLPEFLQLASANVRAGMTLDRALWFAARPEFGLLSKEVELMTKRTFSGEPFNESVRKLGLRFNSKALERTINLLIEGTAAGGEVAELLEKTGQDIRDMQMLHKEIAGTLLMYIIFIIFAAVFGAPLLYALSNQLINITNYIWSGILAQNPGGLPTGGMMFLSPQPPGVTSSDFFTFALLSTILTTAVASLIIGAIQTGNAANGLKIMPILVAAALGLFFVTGYIFTLVFAGILK